MLQIDSIAKSETIVFSKEQETADGINKKLSVLENVLVREERKVLIVADGFRGC